MEKQVIYSNIYVYIDVCMYVCMYVYVPPSHLGIPYSDEVSYLTNILGHPFIVDFEVMTMQKTSRL